MPTGTRTLAALAALLALPALAPAATYHVRTDGGTAEQCSGLADAAYPGSGTGQACAWSHLFQAFPPGGEARIAGGDTVLVGAGSYMVGYGAPGAGACSPDYPWDCYMSEIPAGPDAAHPTRILGAGHDSGCSSPPELWGTERVYMVLNLYHATNVEVACFEITDHSGCVESHSGSIACNRETFPFGQWAVRGLYAEDSANVTLSDLDIHGLAGGGIHAGRLSDWTVEDVRIAGNGWSGWDGDIDGEDSNSGTLTFRRFTVEWNGCGETWPGGEPTACWAQSAGGYGDGFGTGDTAGTWLFEDSTFRSNTSDGLDLLYARAGSSITIRRTLASGNAGNQIKTNGPAAIESSVVVGNCNAFAGKPYTFDVDDCRAAGNAVSLTLRRGDAVTLANNTVTGNGDCLLIADCDTERSSCDGSERVVERNNIFVGNEEFGGEGERTCLFWSETLAATALDADYSLVSGVKDDDCHGDHSLCATAPGLASSALAAFDARLVAGSAAIDAGTTEHAASTDFTGAARDPHPDIGAYEFRGQGGCTVSIGSYSVGETGRVGVPVVFAASAQATGCTGTIAYRWSFGDGSAQATVASTTHTYQAAGTYQWSLTASIGAASDSVTDSITISEGGGAHYSYLVPSVAHAGGAGGTQWRTDIAAVNRTASTASLSLTFTGITPHRTVGASIPPGATRVWRDILISLFTFAYPVDAGAVLIGSDQPLSITSRTYNQTPAGTYGQYFPALTRSDGITSERPGIIPQLRKSAAFRTNIGVAMPSGGDPVQVAVSLHDRNGVQVGATRTLSVEGQHWVQQYDIFANVAAGDREPAYARVTVLTPAARVWAYASVIDTATGDPTMIPVAVLDGGGQ